MTRVNKISKWSYVLILKMIPIKVFILIAEFAPSDAFQRNLSIRVWASGWEFIRRVGPNPHSI